MNTQLNAFMILGFGLIPCTLIGCRSHQVLVEAPAAAHEPPAERELIGSVSDLDTFLWMGVLSELEIMFAEHASKTPLQRNDMPQLIAGDWLAFECALAGGYWDLGEEKGTPVFAEVPESWSIPE
jgi:hypothetical protein